MANISAWTVVECRAKQKVFRSKITVCCNRVRKIVEDKLSKRDAETLLAEARTHLGELSAIHDRLCELLDDVELDTQVNQHGSYCGQIDTASAMIETFSEGSSSDGAPAESEEQRAARIAAEEHRRAARVAAEERVRTLRIQLKEAEQEMSNLGGRVDDVADLESLDEAVPVIEGRTVPSTGEDAGRRTSVVEVKVNSTMVAPAPDDWIDEYCTGREKLVTHFKSEHSSVRVELPTYSGRAVEWFNWIGLWAALVHQTNKTPSEKLAILKKYLDGDLSDIVYGLGGGEAAYKDALARLKETCGNRAVMRAAHLQALEKMDPPRGDPASFKRFAERARTHLFNLTCIGEYGHADVIERLSKKLQLQDRLAWNDGRGSVVERRTMNEFGAWMCSRASAYQNAYSLADDQAHPPTNKNPGQGSSQAGQQRRNARAHQTSTNPPGLETSKGPGPKAPAAPGTASRPSKGEQYCFKCEGDHRLADCTFFRNMPVADRMTFAMRRGLCYGCFGVRHGAETCSFKKTCDVNGCKKTHHPLLHTDKGLPDRVGTTHATRTARSRIAFGVICLDALNAYGELVPVTVLLDGASDSTLFTEALQKTLRIPGQRQTLRVNGVAEAASTHRYSEHLELKLRTAFGEIVTIHGSTVKTITRPVPLMDWEQMRDRWTHLADLPPLRSSGGRIDVLIGLDHASLFTPTESRIGSEDEPTATRSRLGWTVQGVVDRVGGSIVARCHAVFAGVDVEPQLVEQLKRFCDTEAFGTEHQGAGMSVEDRRAVEKCDAQTVKLEVGYEAPVLWKDGSPPQLPDNRVVAETRNRSLVCKFARNPLHEEHFRKAMNKNFSEGYSRRLTAAELEERPSRYWLPIFGVPKVPGQPDLRLVFDAAAKFRGACLNDYVTAGPALQNPLPAVIIRFREGAIAWSADIGAMFSRIRLNEVDSRYHRFLWPEEDGSVSTCEMTRVTFGVACSPYVAIRTTWRAAEDAVVDQGEALTAIRRHVYVDDYLDSGKTSEEAVRRASAVSRALEHGDFHLSHWVSNDSRVLEAFTHQDAAKASHGTVHLGADDPEMVLGITWKPTTDTLGFRVKLTDVQYTRVGLLSKVAGLFDPQGTAAPVTVKAKIRLRELGVKGLKWDDSVGGADRSWWESYFAKVEQLKEVEFARCLFPREDDVERIELHTFTDASEEACAAVCYLRSTYQDGQVVIRHVKAVTKLAPLKTVSVCKLELTAGLMGARLARFVETSLTRPVNSRKFWTDSSTVRNWVRALSGNYLTYVSNRIGEIQTLTDPQEWRFIPGALNPADAATRSQLDDVALPTWWLDGPPFLYSGEATWPIDLPWTVEKKELRVARVNMSVVLAASNTPVDWESIRLTPQNLTALTRLEGEYLHLIRRCQEEAFPDELQRLRRGKTIRPTSSLLPFTPFLDDDGILRLGGRLRRAKLPYDALHPPLLQGRHPFARAIIRAFHERLHHSGTDFTLAHVRQYFWITSGREAVKRVKNECVPCRRFRPKAALQMMADVHKARLGARQPPFTYCSVDYFGPIEVTHGRGGAKRWGALFTCLVTRAVYVDVAASLSSDDFMLVLRRLASMYRKPAEIFSDNGTNLVGAERVLREELEKLKGHSALETELRALGIRWWFQPAQTPHFGGSHESLVRSVKNALYPVLDKELNGQRRPSDEMLRTLLFEVSGLLNARPLTYVSSDPDDFRPLTPNDFLNRAPIADMPAGDFTHSLPRDHYRYVQRMTNQFWDLWHGAFLQSMTTRRKWTTPSRNLAVGDFVLDDWKNAPRGRWRTGRVARVYPGADGLVRAVDVEFPTGVLRRGVHQLAFLESYSPASGDAGSGEDGAAISLN